MVSDTLYRNLLNSFTAAVRGVSAQNRVIAGSLAPLGRKNKPAPLAFMRELLCVSKSLRRTCDLRSAPLRFDIWSHHPYTLGGPTHKAGGDNVSLGDLPRMRRVLRAAIRLGHVSSLGRVQFWVTELGWDTRPPDPRGVPSVLHARWVSEALYRLWTNNVTVATWWRISDDPFPSGRYQSGLYTVYGRPKRSLTAFRFPTVAFRRPGAIYVLGPHTDEPARQSRARAEVGPRLAAARHGSGKWLWDLRAHVPKRHAHGPCPSPNRTREEHSLLAHPVPRSGRRPDGLRRRRRLLSV